MTSRDLASKITLGNALTLIGLLGAFIVFWSSFSSRVSANETMTKEVKENVEKRLDRIEDKLDRALQRR